MLTLKIPKEDDKLMKTLIIGIDGATFDIMLPLIKNGQLPNIGRFVKNGVYGNLRSVFPPVTFPAWHSFHKIEYSMFCWIFTCFKRGPCRECNWRKYTS